MDRERWQRIETLLQAALDLEPQARRSFLEEACGADTGLRREVESLLDHEHDANVLDHSPAVRLLDASLTGRTISHYRIARRIGAGGMGEVYEAHDESLQRTVALKVLPEELTSDADRVRRFEQEALAASRLNHPNIITIFEVLRGGGGHFIATELVEGRTLREILNESQPLPPERALDIAMQVATALKAAHTAWIIHRDIKPENLMVRADGVVKVLDFGIATVDHGRSGVPRDSDGHPARQPFERAGRPSPHTNPGAILGTANYMSPEQARGEPLDGRTDLYSLGLVLREMSGETAPHEIQQVVRKLLQPNRDDRYSSAAELLDELHRVRKRLESRTARRMVRISATAIVAAMILAGFAAFLSIQETWEERVLRDGHTAAARRAVFSPDGRYVVSCGEDGQIFVWDFVRRERVRSLSGGPSQMIDYAPNGRWLAVGGVDGAITILETTRWTIARVLRGHGEQISSLTFSPDSTQLASSSERRMILWDARQWREIRQLTSYGVGHGNFVFTRRGIVASANITWIDGDRTYQADPEISANWIALSPDRNTLAGINPHGVVSFYRVDEREEAHPIRPLANSMAHQDHGRGIAWSPDGRVVASAADDILLWDPTTRTKLARFEYSSIVWSVAFSPDGRWLISTHGDGAVLIWDVAERQCVGSLNEHSAAVRGVAFSPDGTLVASAGDDRTVTLWDTAHRRKAAVLAAHGTRVTSVAFSRDGAMLASVDQSGVTMLWDIANRKPAHMFRNPERYANYCVSISPDHRFLATTGAILTREGRLVLDLLPGPCGQIYGAYFSADGDILATATNRGCLVVWDGRTFRVREQVTTHDGSLITVSFSPDGKWLVTGEDEGAVRLWSVQPLREVAVLGRHGARVKSVAFAPDGRTVASAGDDKMIALWDVRRRTLHTRIGTHASPIYSIAFSPDGRQLVSGEHDRSVRLYTRQRSLWGIRLPPS